MEHKFFRTGAAALAMTIMAGCNGNSYSWEQDLRHRLELDFCRSEQDVTEYIRKYVPEVTESEIAALTGSGKLESMMLENERKYFRNAAPNLFRIDPEYKAAKDSVSGPEDNGYHAAGERSIELAEQEIRSGDFRDCHIGHPQRMRVRYSLTVDAGTVPDGETIRCWLPYPRTDVTRQKDVKFLGAGWISRPDDSSSPQYFSTRMKDSEELTFSGDRSAHSSLYMEAKASEGWPTVFYEEFEYTSYAEWFPICESVDIPAAATGTAGRIPEEFLKERERHIIFTPEITGLRDSLSRGISTPAGKASAFYRWIDATFPWASAREYSTIENIPEYVLENRHGDCGQVSLLFITLCRSAGIPARFQSGFMMHPGHDGMHDWAEIWLEPYGWIPVDQSFGGEKYLGAIDSYRLCVNNDFGRQFIPAKKYPRSETVDFQRGEVEWRGGNIYFDRWNYDMDVEYLE